MSLNNFALGALAIRDWRCETASEPFAAANPY